MSFRTKEELVPETLRQYIEDLRQRYGLAGIGVAAIQAPKSPETDWHSKIHCAGFVAADGRPFEADSLFAIASNSKLICAVVIGLLIHRKTPLPNGGVLTWRTKIKSVLDWKLYDKWAEEHLDVVDLFTMRSGLPRHDMLFGPDTTAEDLLPLLEHCKPTDEPRKTFQYNNVHYALLSLFPQKLLGIPYEQFVKDNIFDPLGMKDSNFDHQRSARSPKAVRGFYHKGFDKIKMRKEMTEGSSSDLTSKKWSAEGSEFEWFTPGTARGFAGPGGAIVTLEDSTRWMRELLDPKVIPKAVLDKISEPLVANPDSHPHPILSHNTYAMGQWQANYRGFKTLQHTGGMAGYGSYIVRIPDQGLACAVFFNDAEFEYHALVPVIGRRWMDLVLGLTPHEWESWEVKECFKVQKEDEEKLPDGAEGKPDDIRGTYISKAYPKLVIKSVEQSSLDLDTIRRTSRLAGHKLDLDGPVYVAEMDRLLISHIVFTPLKGPIWRWLHFFVLPQSERGTQGGAEVGIEVGDKGKAVFVDQEQPGGLAMFDGWIGRADVGIEKRKICIGSEAKEACEMWYARED